ncbi:MAG TPA: fibronectin type III domain-containing protein [Longimicrobiales bacterium]|nr:fibronectin type III domain-containing protein [Longimicrobiales bacterium]
MSWLPCLSAATPTGAALGLAVLLAAACTDTVVTPVDVAVVEIAPNPASVRVGASVRLRASLRDSAGHELSRRIVWSSDDPRVAVVDTAGVVRGVATGATTIRAAVGGRTGTTRVSVQRGPAVHLELPGVRLLAERNQTSPATRDILVTNAGDGTLDGLSVAVAYAEGQPGGWLDARLAAATAPTTVVLEARPGTMAVGDYAATVTVSAPGAGEPASLAVTFTVAPPPPGPPGAPRQLAGTAISATEVALSWVRGSTDEREFRIERRVGTGGAWAQVGLAPAGATSHTDVGAPPASSLFYRVVACNGAGCSGYSNEAAVQTPAQPVLALDRSVLVFGAVAGGANPAAQAVAVTNTGGSSLTGLAVSVGYAAGEPAGWLDATFDATTAPTALRVLAHVSGLAPGSYHATLTVSAPGALGSPATVAVRFDVVAPPPSPPAAPTGLVAQATSATLVTLTWQDASANETAFVVERQSGSAAFAVVDSVGANTTSLQDAVAPATTYTYRVKACNAGGCSAYSNTAQATTPAAAAPPTATTLPASGVTASAATLNGAVTPNLAATTAYFEWGTSATSLTASTSAQSVGSDATVHAVTAALSGLAPATTYFFRVVAQNAQGRTDGAVLSFTTAAAPPPPPTPPAAPSQLSVLGTTKSSVDLAWKDNANNETSFEVERQDPHGQFRKVATLGANVTSYSDGGLKSKSDYDYRVRACNAVGCSAYSNPVSAKTH